jgi:hypothetical protein
MGGLTAMPNETDYAYLAALIDGEGYVGCQNAQGGWRVSLEISMTHRETIDWLKEMFGGNIYTPSVPKPNAKQYWKWQITAGVMREILPRTFPYHITKKHQVELMIEIVSITGKYSREAAEVARKELLCLELKGLNRRGIIQQPCANNVISTK